MGRDRLLKQLLRERFVITMTGGETFDGLLNRVDSQTVELVDAAVITASSGSERRHPVDGALYLPRGLVAYMQRPTG